MTIDRDRRHVLVSMCGAAAYAAWPGLARGQSRWPDHPIQLLIPYPPGGSTDLVARPLAAKLNDALGQPIVMDYKPGAGGILASQALVRAKSDGQTFIMVLAAHAINQSLYSKLPYDTRRDFAPVSLVANLPLLVCASASLKANSIQEVIAYARANPGKLTFGSAGNGNTSHLAPSLFCSMTGIKMLHIPYKGSAPMVNAMLGGEVDMTFDSASTSLPHVQSGRLRPLAVTSEQRLSILPEVPTMKEAGVDNFVVNGWYAVLAPAGTPQTIRDRLSQDIAGIVKQPDFKRQLEGMGYQLVGSSPQALDTHIGREIERWATVVESAGVKLD